MSLRSASASASASAAAARRRLHAAAEDEAHAEPLGFLPGLLLGLKGLYNASDADSDRRFAQSSRHYLGPDGGPRGAALDVARLLNESKGSVAKGGATCKVRIYERDGLVVKTCDTGSTAIELELTKRARRILRDIDPALAPTTLQLGGTDGRQLVTSLFPHGTAYTPHVDGGLAYWSNPDDPKIGRLLNFTPEALEAFKGLVGKLHAAGFAHADIHAGNVVIVKVDPATKQVTQASLLDFSNAVDMELLKGMPDTTRKISVGLERGADWVTPYIKERLSKSHEPAAGLFATARQYDRDRVQIMTKGT